MAEGIGPTERQRSPGGGDIKSEDKQPGLLVALDELVHPETRGNPMSYLRWTSMSTRNLNASSRRRRAQGRLVLAA